MSEHSILPPSGAKAWRQCAAWVAMNKRYPQPATPDTLEGEAAHWAFAELLAGRQIDEGLIAPNGVMLTAEMVDGADLYVDTCRRMVPNAPLNVEQRVAIKQVHPECFGTPDTWAYDMDKWLLDILDYKFGHRYIDEYENDQCVAYASGVLDHISELTGIAPGILDQRVTVRITIVQPRCFARGAPVRTWEVKASDLRAQINQLRMAANAAMADNPTATTNSECRDCPGRVHCQALQQGAYSDAEYAYRSGPLELPPRAASLELRMMERALERLQARVEGLKEAVTGYGRQGYSTPYHKLEQGYGRQAWTAPPADIIALGTLMGVDLSKPGVMTPKQAVKAGVDEGVIKAYSNTPMGSVKLIPCNPADARRVFGITKEMT